MARQAVTLGDLVGCINGLEVRCTRCPRHGRVRLAQLLAEHGADLGMPDLAVRLAADCPKAQATSPAGLLARTCARSGHPCFCWPPYSTLSN